MIARREIAPTMTDRQAALRSIEAGNLFYALDAAGPVRICLGLSVSEKTILARSVTTQEIIKFDRRTGEAAHNRYGFDFNYLIASIMPLPRDIHEIMLSLDRNGRAFEEKLAEDPDYQSPPDNWILNDDQRRGLLFIAEFCRAHPLPT
jgi:hypothetical protein